MWRLYCTTTLLELLWAAKHYLILEMLIDRSSYHLDGKVDRQICLSYFRRADPPSPLLSLYLEIIWLNMALCAVK